MFTLGELAEKIDAELLGDASCLIRSVASLSNAQSGSITFSSNKRLRHQLKTTKASAVIITSADKEHSPTNSLVVADPYVAYAKIATLFHPHVNEQQGRHPTAVVDAQAQIDDTAWIGPMVVVEKGAKIGPNCEIGPGSFIGEDVSIAADTRLYANVTVYHHCQIGQRAIIHSGVVIGADGFGFANDGGDWLKIPQVGRVILGDDIEIGANSTVDRGAIDNTIIGNGVKIDNLVQIAHNVHIGEHSVLAAQVGIAGSAKIGKHCTLGGKVGVVGHLVITDHVTITGRSLVVHSITEPGMYSSGMPADTATRWRKNVTRFRQLDELARTVKWLEKRFKNK